MEYPPSAFTEELTAELDRIGPFGKGNEKPLFAMRGVRILQPRLIGSERNFVKMTVNDGYGSAGAIFFRGGAQEKDLLLSGDAVDIAYYPEINEFRGKRSVEIVVTNVRRSGF